MARVIKTSTIYSYAHHPIMFLFTCASHVLVVALAVGAFYGGLWLIKNDDE
jgi:hypothetical protein